MLSIISITQADIAISANSFTTINLKQIQNDKIEIYTPEKAITAFLYPGIRIGCWNKIYKKDLIEKHKLRFIPELTTGEGLQFITNITQFANHIGVGHRKVYYYRINNINSATTKPNVERQGKGSLATIEYIKNNLLIKSPQIEMALRWHTWSCYLYTLRNISEAKEEKKYKDLYVKCIIVLRKETIPLLKTKISFKQKIKIILIGINPVICTRLIILKRRIQIKSDKIE